MWAQFNVLFIIKPNFLYLVYSVNFYVVYINVIFPLSYTFHITEGHCMSFLYLEKVYWF